MSEKSIAQRNEEIKNQLREKGYANKLIDYQEFLELYEPYKKEMSERDFASIIGISDYNYQNIKYYAQNARILKMEDVAEKRKEEIKIELREKGYANKIIEYEEFQELYEPYKKEMREEDFASIIGISYNSYIRIKNTSRKAKILKTEKVSVKRKEEIINKLNLEGYRNKSIGYKEFQELYEPYKNEMKEVDFASVIGISYSSYGNMKNVNANVIILKVEKVAEERKEEIVNKLRLQGYGNKSIDYKEFKELYEPHKNEMKEVDFANAIGISYNSYIKIKSKSRKAKILKTENVSIKRKEEIVNKLRLEGYGNKSIDYKEFQELYEPYKNEMKEVDFASILNISYPSYSRIKYKVGKTKILKTEDITEERKKEITNQLRLEGHVNKLIDYKEFLNLYEPYKNEISELNFASILGIAFSSYKTIKSRNAKASIKFKSTELNRIKHQLKQESREYKKEELEQLCNQYNVTLYELLASLYGVSAYTDNLIKRDSIYIGKCEISKEFQQKYAKNLLVSAQRISRILTSKYNLRRYCEDFASDVLMYIIKNKGDCVRNSDDDIESLNGLSSYMKVFIENECIRKLRLKVTVSLDEDIGENKANRFRTTERYTIVKDNNVHFWEDIEEEEGIMPENGKIAMLMRECYDQGMNNVEAIKCITERYGISKEELLKILEQELTKRRKVVKTADGKVYLGEEVE